MVADLDVVVSGSKVCSLFSSFFSTFTILGLLVTLSSCCVVLVASTWTTLVVTVATAATAVTVITVVFPPWGCSLQDGTCIVHSLRPGRYVRSIEPPGKRPVAMLALASDATVVIYVQVATAIRLSPCSCERLRCSCAS